jgi:hypothetical protein
MSRKSNTEDENTKTLEHKETKTEIKEYLQLAIAICVQYMGPDVNKRFNNKDHRMFQFLVELRTEENKVGNSDFTKAQQQSAKAWIAKYKHKKQIASVNPESVQCLYVIIKTLVEDLESVKDDPDLDVSKNPTREEFVRNFRDVINNKGSIKLMHVIFEWLALCDCLPDFTERTTEDRKQNNPTDRHYTPAFTLKKKMENILQERLSKNRNLQSVGRKLINKTLYEIAKWYSNLIVNKTYALGAGTIEAFFREIQRYTTAVNPALTVDDIIEEIRSYLQDSGKGKRGSKKSTVDDDDDEDDSEDEKKKSRKKKAASDDEDSDDEKKKPSSKANGKKAAASDDEDEPKTPPPKKSKKADSDDDEDDAPKRTPAKKAKKAADSDDDEDEDAPKRTPSKKTKKAADSDDEDDAPKKSPAKKTTKTADSDEED